MNGLEFTTPKLTVTASPIVPANFADVLDEAKADHVSCCVLSEPAPNLTFDVAVVPNDSRPH